MKPNCWDCKYFERVRMSAFCHGGKKVTKLPQKYWYSGNVKFCTYFEAKAEEVGRMTAQEKDRIVSAIGHINTAVDVDEWAAEIAVDAMEKQIPKKPIPDGYKDKCPACGLVVKFGEHYCKGCGSALDWKVEE